MATIENHGANPVDMFRGMADEELMAQDISQQGAIHAIGFLLAHGANEATATDMMASLRENARLIREEARRRGKPSLFSEDQIDAATRTTGDENNG